MFRVMLFLLAASQAFSQAPATMTKLVVRLSGPDIKPGSFAALPKTIYFADPHYARIEDPPDARQGIQKLVVIAEPDAYSVNLTDHKGTHVIDRGGPNDLHLPIVLPFDPKHHLGALDRLEFGAELAFFQAGGAVKEAGPIINAKPTNAWVLKKPNVTATLVVRDDTGTPVTLTWKTGSERHIYEYITDQEMPFDPGLFRKPEGVRYREIKPDPGELIN
jgi:hypothetical protein